VDFCAISNAKTPIIRHTANLWFDGVCRVKQAAGGVVYFIIDLSLPGDELSDSLPGKQAQSKFFRVIPEGLNE
jgi:hypothetical protein